jgi:diguanylate cyclase (GGDEF)-like protein
VTADPAFLAAAGPLLAAALQREQSALVVKDGASGAWLHAGAPMPAWLGRSAEALVGCQDSDLFDAATAAALRSADQAALARDGAVETEHRTELGGAKREFGVLRQQVSLPDGRTLLAAVWRDLGNARRRDAQARAALEQLEQAQSENAQLRREVAQAALRDDATGLAGGAQFDDQLRREVDLSTREHREFALVSIALDAPAPDAAALGEPVRTRILEALGRLLRGNTRAMDASCRYGADRFAVLLSGVGLATAHSRMEGLRRQCATQIVAHEGREFGFTVSMGVASFPHTAHTQEDLRAACDKALAEAIARGGNRVTLASIRFDSEG